VVAHGVGAVVSNTVVLIMTQLQVRSSLRQKIAMETVVVMSLVSSRRSTVQVVIVGIVDSVGEISFLSIDGYKKVQSLRLYSGNTLL
jgi:hypothetical protein